MMEWWNGRMVEWQNGRMVEWQRGKMKEKDIFLHNYLRMWEIICNFAAD